MYNADTYIEFNCSNGIILALHVIEYLCCILGPIEPGTPFNLRTSGLNEKEFYTESEVNQILYN